MAHTASPAADASQDGQTRRDFLLITTGVVSAVGAALAVWPFIHQMNPAADTLAVATTGVDLAPIAVGQAITVIWQGKPVFIRHRTPADIESAVAVSLGDLADPQPDSARVEKPEWLVIVGVCTHLGCIPLGQKASETKGEFGGWFCPCHGSHYDTSGRIRKGPAPSNMTVPAYTFISDSQIQIG